MKKQKIVLAAGVFPPQIGGPAKYAKNMYDELIKKGFEVKVATYFFEHKLPSGIRHVWYFFKLFFLSLGAKAIFAFDTLSTGVPAALVGKILNKKVVVRIGGDFLWETYVELAGDTIPLPLIYQHKERWTIYSKTIFKLTNFLFKIADSLVFNSEWLRNIFLQNYKLDKTKTFVVKNVFNGGQKSVPPLKKKFLWAGRPIKLKNIDNFKIAFEEAKKNNPDIELEILTDVPHNMLMEKISSCYAIALPSYSDVAPNLIIEGIERGKPFVCTKHTSLITDFSDCGVFVDPESIDDMKKGILELSDDSVYVEKVKMIEQCVVWHNFEDITNEFLKIANI